MRAYVAIFFAFFILCSNATAQEKSICDSALRPTEEWGSRSKKKLQAYAFLNAAYEYDQLHDKTQTEKDASAVYKAFKAAFESSQSGEEFQEKVRQTLASENIHLDEAEASSYYRIDLTPDQLKAWANCVFIGDTGHSHVFLNPRILAENAIALTVEFRGSDQGVKDNTLKIDIVNGTIQDDATGKNTNHLEAKVTGPSTVFMVFPDSSDRAVAIIANIDTASANTSIPKDYPKPSSNIPAFVDVELISQPYTTQDDGRISKHLTCIGGKAIVPNSGNCHRTSDGPGAVAKLKKNEQLGPYTWACQWAEPQNAGVGLWAEAQCGTPTGPVTFRNVRHVRQDYTTERDGRISKNFSCPDPGQVIVPSSATCLLTAPGDSKIKKSRQINDQTWFCEWDRPQPPGVGMWIEMDCGEKIEQPKSKTDQGQKRAGR